MQRIRAPGRRKVEPGEVAHYGYWIVHPVMALKLKNDLKMRDQLLDLGIICPLNHLALTP